MLIMVQIPEITTMDKSGINNHSDQLNSSNEEYAEDWNLNFFFSCLNNPDCVVRV